jgi:type III restriction enzyme
MAFRVNPLPFKEDKTEVKTFIYEGRDILTAEKLFEREYAIPPAQTSQEVIGYYARRIAQNIKLPTQFAALVPKIKEFFEQKAFGKKVELDDPATIKAMSSNLANYVVTKEFERVLRDIVVEEKKPQLLTPKRLLSTTPPFPFSKLFFESKKSVFNYVACANEFERSFEKFLNGAEDVIAFAKLPEQFGFCIEYTDALANLRHYYPDFVLRLENGEHCLVETKGREDIEVKRKDEAARNWCSNATDLTGVSWKYVKVPQKVFEELNPSSFSELEAALL